MRALKNPPNCVTTIWGGYYWEVSLPIYFITFNVCVTDLFMNLIS